MDLYSAGRYFRSIELQNGTRSRPRPPTERKIEERAHAVDTRVSPDAVQQLTSAIKIYAAIRARMPRSESASFSRTKKTMESRFREIDLAAQASRPLPPIARKNRAATDGRPAAAGNRAAWTDNARLLLRLGWAVRSRGCRRRWRSGANADRSHGLCNLLGASFSNDDRRDVERASWPRGLCALGRSRPLSAPWRPQQLDQPAQHGGRRLRLPWRLLRLCDVWAAPMGRDWSRE